MQSSISLTHPTLDYGEADGQLSIVICFVKDATSYAYQLAQALYRAKAYGKSALFKPSGLS